MARKKKTTSYTHPEASALLRPDVGTQTHFHMKKPPATYRYDSSLSPALDWDEQNPAREHAEANLSALKEGITTLSAILDFEGAHNSGIFRVEVKKFRKGFGNVRNNVAKLESLWNGLIAVKLLSEADA